MKTDTPALTVEEQNKAAEEIIALIAQGLSSGEAIKQVADKIRQNHKGEYIHMGFEEE
ncbi:YoaH family protein [Thorsellia kenyensis]|uniref:YoaH family protein n=1 Tax=Thorsellia kenyensis TaxID=1549888 RepID=A0ABV6CCI9_9GAMM